MTAFAEEGTARFLLENTGVHIPDSELPKLFDAFYRVEHSRNKKTGGSGLDYTLSNHSGTTSSGIPYREHK